MNIEKQLKKCDKAYEEGNYKKLLKLSDEILKQDSKCQNAIGYKSIVYIFQNQPQKAIEILEEGIKLFPNNYYLKNHLSMAYYDMGEYEKSLKHADEGLKIKKFDWLYENRIKALIKLNRIEEADESWQNAPINIDFTDLLIEAEKYDEAIRYALDEDYDEYLRVIDNVKEKNPEKAGKHYLIWIDEIKKFNNTKICPDCGGKLMPIVYGYPTPEMLKKHDNGEIFLGGCVIPPNPPNYRCSDCRHEFDLGCNGLEIELSELYAYAEYKINELTNRLRETTMIWVRRLDEVKSELKGYDDVEFNALITRLIDLGYLCTPREGYVKLTGFDELKIIKGYCDEGKYAAPRWLVYPEYSIGTIGWRMGAGENYAMNEPHHSEEFKRLFPMPKNWQYYLQKTIKGPYPPLGFPWSSDGKPKYPKNSTGFEVNGFITLNDEKPFQCDTFTFSSIEHAVRLSKALYFKRYHDKKVDSKALDELEYSVEEEKVWDAFKYTVLLNAAYYKIMSDEKLKEKLLGTGDEPLIYASDDGENLFGRALMELRDEIRRLTRNIGLIDWGYTEYLKIVPWM